MTRELLSLAIAAASLAAVPGAALAQEGAVTFTTMTAGPFRRVATVAEDLEALLAASASPDRPPARIGALRRGDWVVYGGGAAAEQAAVEEAARSGKWSIAGPGRKITTVRKGATIAFSETNAGIGRYAPGAGPGPDGAVWDLAGVPGQQLRLVGFGDDVAAARVLREGGWVPTAAARGSAGPEGQAADVIAVSTVEGGFAVFDAARRQGRSGGARWIDGGNLVDDSNDARGRRTLPLTLESLPAAGVALVVPYKNELRLSRADQARLARAVPLVAANLTAPPDVPIKPFEVLDVGGSRVGFVGIADAFVLARNNLLGAGTGWSAQPEAPALASAVAAARAQGAEAIVVVTNKAAGDLASLGPAAAGAAAILTFDYDPGAPQRSVAARAAAGLDRAWLVGRQSPVEIGLLSLDFEGGKGGGKSLAAVRFETARPSDRDLADPQGAARVIAAQAAFDAAFSDSVLPDSRTLPFPRPAYGSREWTRLAAAALRAAAGADAAVIATRRGGRIATGEVSRAVALDWLPAGTGVAVADMRGDALRGWVASLGKDAGVAGYDPATGRIGGRKLVDAEVYRIVTTDSFAHGGAFAPASEPRTDLALVGDLLVPGGSGATVADVVLARLDTLRTAHGGFGAGFGLGLAALLGDDGKALEPRWSVSLAPLDVSFNDSLPYNTSAFSSVPNSRISAPATQTLRSKATVTAAYDGAEVAWQNTGTLKYDAATITASASQQIKQLTNELRLGSRIMGNALAAQIPAIAGQMLPFAELAYVTEVVPGTNSRTGAQNPRRQDTLAIAGFALRGSGWLTEAEAAFEARKNFAVVGKDIEPGGRLGLSLGRKLGIVDLSLETELDAFLPIAGDTAADLGLSGQFGLAAKVPLGAGLAMRVGVDGLVFRGKIPATESLGAVITPSIGLSYGATWKPLTGVFY
ncbi:MAG: hypothetical protein FJZ01_01840 [Candidatus Sericytochromatia bacterium]|nr:hypothetical protein [Candidatus Tanganyikabacteria bacterium]